MSRYIMANDAPKADDNTDWYPMPAQTMVHPSISVGPPIDTGLLDQHGRKLYRIPDEIGFMPRREGR